MSAGLNCNLACKYCYHGAVSAKLENSFSMSNEVLSKIIEGASEISLDSTFLWHGGEPLLAGLSHFEEALRLQKLNSFQGKVVNILQSNMTLMSKKKASFFFKNGFRVSTSLDGSRESHNANRVFPGDVGSYDSVIDAISRFNTLGAPVGSICLITKSNVNNPDGTYREMLQSGVESFNYHICAQDEEGSIEVMPRSVDVTRFTKRLFDLWLEADNPAFKIRNFRNVIRGLCGGSPLECSSKTSVCRAFIAFDSNGDVYPCHRFVGRKQYIIGNVLDRPLKEIFISSVANDIYNEMAIIPRECQKCEWLNVCGAGCSYERLIGGGSFGAISFDCEIKKPLFEHIKESVKYLI
jgi:uncharacterized protein